MKVKNDFISRTIADEHLLIPTGEAALRVKGLISLSESGAFLYQTLRNDCTRNELVSALTAEYDVPASVAEADIDAFLEQMRQLDMLAEE